MKSGHASHQIGLDVDIWLQPMPDNMLSATEREDLSAVSVLKQGTRNVDPKRFGEAQRLLIYRAAQLPDRPFDLRSCRAAASEQVTSSSGRLDVQPRSHSVVKPVPPLRPLTVTAFGKPRS